MVVLMCFSVILLVCSSCEFVLVSLIVCVWCRKRVVFILFFKVWICWFIVFCVRESFLVVVWKFRCWVMVLKVCRCLVEMGWVWGWLVGSDMGRFN